ncbi:hypothetical protein BC830DRAFT_85106, partial [Chytriomyces sp. MP71]
VLRHVGSFQGSLAQGFRAQTDSTCQAQNVVNETPESTITHLAPIPGLMKSMTLMWTPPAQNEGIVTVNMVFAGNVLEGWMVVPSVQIQSTEGMLAGQSASARNAEPAPAANFASSAEAIGKGLVPNVAQLPETVVDDLTTLVGGGSALTNGVMKALKNLSGAH